MEESVKSAPSRDGLWRWAAGREAALLALVAFAVVLWPRGVLNDGDTWWHLSAGDWILAHQAVPHADPFSYTFAGQPWVAHEWLSEVLLSLSYSGAGWPGVMLLTAAACGFATWLLARFVDKTSISSFGLQRELRSRHLALGLLWGVVSLSCLIGLLMIVMGGIWILQGLNIAFLNSFMADQRQWALYGAILALVGLAQLIWSNTRKR